MERVKKAIRENLRQYGMLLAFATIVILFEILTKGVLLKPLNITNLIQQNSYVLILAIGMLLPILCGFIDLSVGSIVAIVGAVSAKMMVTAEMPVLLTVIVALLIGLAIGAWHGFWIAYVRIPPFIVTLSGMLVFRGLTMVILKGQTIAPMPKSFQQISSGFVPDFLGSGGTGDGTLHIATLVIAAILCALFVYTQFKNRSKRAKYGFEVGSMGVFIAKNIAIVAILMAFSYQLAVYKGFPMVLVLLGALILIYNFITQDTVIGRHIYAFGGNEKAASLSGINTKLVFFGVYANMGLLAAVAGLIFTGRLNAATPKAGQSFEMDAIGACYIGGASASGGIGTVMGAMIGGLIMGVLNNGMSILGVSIDWQQAIKGIILLLAVAFDVLSKSKSSK